MRVRSQGEQRPVLNCLYQMDGREHDGHFTTCKPQGGEILQGNTLEPGESIVI